MTDEEQQRLLWLERKVTELLWAAIIAGAVFIGWLTAYIVATYLMVDAPEWLTFGVFIVGWLVGGFILQRHTFRGAPKHIQYFY
jgi:hypothetical protein